jgi:hypothetical protein
MAIHTDLPGISVEVCVADVSLQEFSDPNDPNTKDGSASPATVFNAGEEHFKTILKFIQSEAGKEFKIKWAIQKPFDFDAEMLGIDIYINNKVCIRNTVKKSVYEKGGEFTAEFDGVRSREGGKEVFRAFKFVDIERSEFQPFKFRGSWLTIS